MSDVTSITEKQEHVSPRTILAALIDDVDNIDEIVIVVKKKESGEMQPVMCMATERLPMACWVLQRFWFENA